MSPKTIKKFRGPYWFLSNFYPASVRLGRTIYPTVEHAYQAAKTLSPKDRSQIGKAASPSAAKAMGKQITLRKDWESVKLEIMENLVYQKFSRHIRLRTRLLATGDAELQEVNWWNDEYWGINDRTGEGQNHLGQILMKVRSSFQ